jgi:chromosome partitioning protein
MGKVIAVTNQKGGVGKTTTCINLAASLAATKRRILLVDMDPQGNATMGSGVDKNSLKHTTGDLLLGDVAADELLIKTEQAGFDLLPSNINVTAAEVALMELPDRERRLRDALITVQEDYDFILVDCPPSLNLLTVNALVAADSVMIPMQCEYYALEGLSALLETVEQIRSTVNPRLKIEGLLRTMFDPRNNLANDVSGQLLMHFPNQVYRTIIPRNVRLAEAPSHGLPALNYDRASRGSLAYLALAGEILRKDENVPVASSL